MTGAERLVLPRLNPEPYSKPKNRPARSVLEPGGTLLLNEAGGAGAGGPRVVTPHPDFRLVLALDPRCRARLRAQGAEAFRVPGSPPWQAACALCHQTPPEPSAADDAFGPGGEVTCCRLGALPTAVLFCPLISDFGRQGLL